MSVSKLLLTTIGRDGFETDNSFLEGVVGLGALVIVGGVTLIAHKICTDKGASKNVTRVVGAARGSKK